MTNPAAPPPPGWYPEPGAFNALRYWNGSAWTPQRAPMAPQQIAVVAAPAGPNHLLHLILTLVTCGLWAPVWLLVAIAASRPTGAPMSRGGSVVAVVALVLVVAGLVALNLGRYS